MKHIFSFLLLITILCNCLLFINHASAQSWKWGISNTTNFDGFVEAAPVTTDLSGNSFVAGLFTGGGTISDDSIVIGSFTIQNSVADQLIIVKADSSGNVLWASSVYDATVLPSAMTVDKNGNLYLLAENVGNDSCTIGTVTLHNPYHYVMPFIVKYSPTGVVLWAQNVAGSASSSAGGGIGVDAGNNLYVGGSFNLPEVTIGTTMLYNTSLSGDSEDIFIAKYNSSGNSIWAKSFGGHSNDYASYLSVTDDGNFFISGGYTSQTMVIGPDTITDSLYDPYADPPSPFTFIARFDSSGHPLWAQDMNRHITIASITSDNFDNLYIAGSLDNTILLGIDTLYAYSGPSALVVKYDSASHILWANAAHSGYGGAIAVDKCGNVWEAGRTYGIMNFDSSVIDTPIATNADLSFFAAYDHCGHYIPASGMELPSGGDDALGIALDTKGNLFFGSDYEDVKMAFAADTLPAPISTSVHREYLLLAKCKIGITMPCDNSICIFPPTISFIAGADSVCQDSCITFTNNSAGTIDSLHWSISGVSISDPHSNIISACFPSTGNDTVTLSVFKGGITYSLTKIVTVKRAPHPTIVYPPCCSVPAVYDSYEWVYLGSAPDTLFADTSNTQVFTKLGAYYAVVDSAGCFGISDTAYLSDGVTNINAPNYVINIYPTPAITTVTISSTGSITEVSISNISGQVVYSNTYNAQQVKIDIADLPAGIYFVKVNGVQVRRFMKE